MSKYIFLLIIIIIVGMCISIFINIFLQFKKKKFSFIKDSKNIIKITIIIVMLFYGIWSYQRYLLLVKLKYFSNEVASLLTSYKTTYGNYPRSISELDSYETYKQKKHYLLLPISHEFGLIGYEQGEKYKYTFYAYGFDNDDDKLKNTYGIDFIYALFPNKDGDIILDNDSLKEIKLWENINNQKE